jgi:hypothetical protein
MFAIASGFPEVNFPCDRLQYRPMGDRASLMLRGWGCDAFGGTLREPLLYENGCAKRGTQSDHHSNAVEDSGKLLDISADFMREYIVWFICTIKSKNSERKTSLYGGRVSIWQARILVLNGLIELGTPQLAATKLVQVVHTAMLKHLPSVSIRILRMDLT